MPQPYRGSAYRFIYFVQSSRFFSCIIGASRRITIRRTRLARFKVLSDIRRRCRSLTMFLSSNQFIWCRLQRRQRHHDSATKCSRARARFIFLRHANEDIWQHLQARFALRVISQHYLRINSLIGRALSMGNRAVASRISLNISSSC